MKAIVLFTHMKKDHASCNVLPLPYVDHSALRIKCLKCRISLSESHDGRSTTQLEHGFESAVYTSCIAGHAHFFSYGHNSPHSLPPADLSACFLPFDTGVQLSSTAKSSSGGMCLDQ